MAMVKTSSSSPRRGRKALTPEARENQLIALAVDRAEQQLLDGTASSQVITHFLKLATTKAQLEKEKLVKENKLLEAKADAIEHGKRYEEIVERALKAMQSYKGVGDDTDDY